MFGAARKATRHNTLRLFSDFFKNLFSFNLHLCVYLLLFWLRVTKSLMKNNKKKWSKIK